MTPYEMHHAIADALGLHPDSIQLDDVLATAERYARSRATEELRNIAGELRRCANNATGQAALTYQDAADRAADHADVLDADQ